MALYKWHITVCEYNTYGNSIERETPAIIIASDKKELFEKMCDAFNATYDDFRKFWSHGYTLEKVVEILEKEE